MYVACKEGPEALSITMSLLLPFKCKRFRYLNFEWALFESEEQSNSQIARGKFIN